MQESSGNTLKGYVLSRDFFSWTYSNPEKITSVHVALYFFCIEHWNFMGNKEKFGLPTEKAKESIGIKSYNTYINTLRDLVDFGFIKMIEKSKNQYSANIIALSNFNKALDKAYDKATTEHLIKQVSKQVSKQSESTCQSISSIDKLTNLETNKQEVCAVIFSPIEEKLNQFYVFRKEMKKPILNSSKDLLKKKLIKLSGNNEQVAIEIIEQSIANGWQGLFELKNKINALNLTNGQQHKDSNGKPISIFSEHHPEYAKNFGDKQSNL